MPPHPCPLCPAPSQPAHLMRAGSVYSHLRRGICKREGRVGRRQQTPFCAHVGEDTLNWAVPRKGECSSPELSVNLAASDLATQWTKIPSSLGGQR